MFTTIPEEEHQATLIRWSGAQALISRFHASLRRMVIELYRPEDKGGMLYLIAVGCTHFRGPFYWDSAEITISEALEEASGRMSYLRDENVGFELQYRGGLGLYYGTWEGVRNDFYVDPDEQPADHSECERSAIRK